MTSSTSDAPHVYVWTWLPGHTEPVVAGLLRRAGNRILFGYGSSYLARPDAISLYSPELPLRDGFIEPLPGLTLAGALRDGSPDAWGRRVIEARLGVDEGVLSEEQYMLASGSQRLGAIDFQATPHTYEPRVEHATLDELHAAADLLQQGEALSPAISEALVHGTSIGGARPKVLLTDSDGVEWIAKLSAASDKIFSVPNAEAVSLALARRAGITVPDFAVTTSLGREVLLVKRFDHDPDGQRRHVVSALTMAAEDEYAARYVTYPTILDVLRQHGAPDTDPGRDLFQRIAFNMAVSNSDDHARNHAAFWNGQHLRLTPAYDLAPNARSGEVATQAMAYSRNADGTPGEKASNFATLISHAHVYGLTRSGGREIVEKIVDTINEGFDDAAEQYRMPAADRRSMWRHQFLNPGVLHGL